MAFYAKIGNDGLIHRVSSAMFKRDSAEGIAFCRVEGRITYAETEVATCPGCRELTITYAMNRLNNDSGGTDG